MTTFNIILINSTSVQSKFLTSDGNNNILSRYNRQVASLISATSQFYCRYSSGYVTISDFNRISCAHCFVFIFPDNELTLYDNSYLISRKVLIRLHAKMASQSANESVIQKFATVNETYVLPVIIPDWKNLKCPVYSYLKDEKERNSWRDCCKAAQYCCDTNAVQIYIQNYPVNIMDDYCPATWDGWHCWPRSKANTQNSLPCPAFIHGSGFHISMDSRASKTCQPNGTWLKVYDPKRGTFKEWSNYTQCLTLNLNKKRQYVRMTAYLISILAIVPALLFYKIFKLLHTARVILHANLMVSFLLKAITVIVFDTFYVSQQSWNHTTHNHFSSTFCNCFAFFNKYLLLTSYCWMFNEGIYLYNILVFALNFKSSVRAYLLFGWGFPLFPVIIYVVLKRARDRNGCWIMNVSHLDWIINSICIIILSVNVIFLIQIIRIIFVKLKTGVQKEHLWYRQMVKAVIFLIPLFGIQILLTLYRPPISKGFLEAYHIADSLLEGLQGFFVALIFCYLNGEVLSKFQAKWRRESEERMSELQNQKSLLP